MFEATVLTVAITTGLTVYAWTTKTDFTFLNAFLFMFSFGMAAFSIICMTIGYKLPLLYSYLGVILFGVYLIVDT